MARVVVTRRCDVRWWKPPRTNLSRTKILRIVAPRGGSRVPARGGPCGAVLIGLPSRARCPRRAGGGRDRRPARRPRHSAGRVLSRHFRQMNSRSSGTAGLSRLGGTGLLPAPEPAFHHGGRGREPAPPAARKGSRPGCRRRRCRYVRPTGGCSGPCSPVFPGVPQDCRARLPEPLRQPKIGTNGWPASSKSTLAGLRSRWTKPRRWA